MGLGAIRRATALAAILTAAVMSLASPARAQQACVPPPQNILAWWPFDETAGPTAAELIAGRVGTYFGSPTPAPGEVGNALQFHGSPDFVGVANDPVWHFGVNDFSIELWANFSAPTGGSIGEPSDIFIGNDDGPGDQNKWFFALGGGFLNFHVNSPTLGPMFFPLAPFTPALNTWYHLAVTRAGSLYTLYINGTPVASATNTASIPSPSAFLTIGEAENIGFVNGLLDEVTIYNRALTTAEISSIWAAGPAGKCKPGSGMGLTISSVNPSTGGNAGQVTVSISGSGFAPGAAVSLVTSDLTTLVTGTDTGITASGVLQTTFDLTGLTPSGSLLVQVLNPDGTSATSLFTVVSGGGPEIQLEIVGPATARVGRETPFVALLRNTGLNDLPYAIIQGEVDFASTTEALSPDPAYSPPEIPFGPPPPVQVALDTDPPSLFVGPVRTGESNAIEIPVTFSGDHFCPIIRGRAVMPLPSPSPPPLDRCSQLELDKSFIQAAINANLAAITKNDEQYKAEGCAGDPDNAACQAINKEAGVLLNKSTNLMNELKEKQDEAKALGCADPPDPGYTLAILASASQQTCPVTSWDPNEKAGPLGVGPQGFVSGNVLPYTVFFQNLATATAPAQQISVVDPLDPSVDVNSVVLRALTLGGTVYDLGGGQHADTTVDLRPTTNALLQVQADVDTTRRQISWAMTALDPTTLKISDRPERRNPAARHLPAQWGRIGEFHGFRRAGHAA